MHRHLKICDAAHGVERLHRSDNILENKLYYRIYTCKIAKYRVYWLSNLLINSWRAVFYEKSYIQGCRQACRRIPNNRFLCNEQYPQCVFIRRDPKKSAGRSKSKLFILPPSCQKDGCHSFSACRRSRCRWQIVLTTAARYHTVHIKAASITLGLMLYRLINEDSGPLNTRYLLMCWA